MDLKEEEILGEAIDSHWYYTSKAKMMATHLGGQSYNLLDVGAGSGWFSRWLLENNVASRSTCVDIGYPEDSKTEINGKELSFQKAIEQSDADMILMMDVLEHVDDDIGLLKSYLDKTPAGASAFITVPAFQFLWSPHDDYLEHRRRYTIKSLTKTVEGAGAHVQSIHYFYGGVFPIAMMVRLLNRITGRQGSDLRPHGKVVNSILAGICAVECYIMRANKIAGLSVVCLCSR